MRGGSLTRFRPDDQFGSGFVRDFIGSSVKEGWEGLKKGWTTRFTEHCWWNSGREERWTTSGQTQSGTSHTGKRET